MPNDKPQTTPPEELSRQDLWESIPTWKNAEAEIPVHAGQYIVRLKNGEAKIIGYYEGPMCSANWDEPYHDQVVFWMPVENLGVGYART